MPATQLGIQGNQAQSKLAKAKLVHENLEASLKIFHKKVVINEKILDRQTKILAKLQEAADAAQKRYEEQSRKEQEAATDL